MNDHKFNGLPRANDGVNAETKEKPKKRIIIVDDEESILVGLGLLLEDMYEVVTVDNGQAFRDKLKTEHFDLAIIDRTIKTDNSDGLEMLKEIRQTDKSIKAIILSGELVEEEARKAGASFFQKPVDSLDLEAKIEELFTEESK